MKDSVVVFNDILQSREPAVMIEPAIRVAPESGKWRCTVHVCRRAVRLERIHTDLARSMKVVPRLREKRRHMAARTFALAIEDFFAAFCRALVEAPIALSSSASKQPGPQLARTVLSVATSTPSRSVKGIKLGAKDTMAPTFKSRFAQPSSRLPIPGAKDSSTVE